MRAAAPVRVLAPDPVLEWTRAAVLAVGLALGGLALPLRAMDLAESIAAAEKNDPALASAQANRDAAFENIAIARSKLRPQVNLQSSYDKMQYGLSQQTPQGGSLSNSYLINAYNNQISLRQALYHPRDQIGLDLGKQQARYGDEKLASARSDLWMRVSDAWLDVLVASENERIYALSVEATESAALQAQKRLQAGDGTKDALAEAQAQRSLAESQHAEARITLRARELTFQTLTGQAPENLATGHLPGYDQIRVAVRDKAELQQLVQETNPEIQAATAVWQVNQRRAEQAHADRLPAVDLMASKSWAQNDTVFTINQTYTVLSAGVQVTIPLYAGGGLVATQRQAEFSARAAEQDLRTEKVKRTNAVDTDWAAVEASLERARSAKVLWEAALEQGKAARLGIRSGVRTWAEVAQAEVLAARRAVDFVSYQAEVLRAQARLLSNLPVTENVWEPWVATVSVLSRQAPDERATLAPP